ncbi:MAG: polysaccharide pyruvyl transferase family protein [Rhizobiales bacterium]|nr:polysaccharide pyruvyl transferase family protein [Hyphomicrobiales bacterium]
MFERPLVLGVTKVLTPASIPVTDALSMLGRNSGNLLFTEALYQCIANAEFSHYDVRPSTVEGRDCIVIAAANWLASDQDFSWLSDQLEQVDLPVFIVGLGVQTTLEQTIPKLKPGTRKLLDILNERSKYISVRGQFTAEVLEHYGINKAVVTGCPSLLLAGGKGFSIETPSSLSQEKICVHGTRHQFNDTDEFQKYIYRQAFTRGIDIILQSELADMYYALGRTGNDAVLQKAAPPLLASYGASQVSDIAIYLRRHGKVFFDLPTWLNYLKSRSFCVGTRIHGTIAALLAGVPGTLIVHDARTKELAEAMSIPFRLASTIDTSKDIIFNDLYDGEQTDQFVQSYPAYLSRFRSFFSDNDLLISQHLTLAAHPV